jgi:hypothetical protein
MPTRANYLQGTIVGMANLRALKNIRETVSIPRNTLSGPPSQYSTRHDVR